MGIVFITQGLLFLAVCGPCELVKTIIEIIGNVGAGLAPGFVGGEKRVRVKGDGFDGGTVVGRVGVEVKFRGGCWGMELS